MYEGERESVCRMKREFVCVSVCVVQIRRDRECLCVRKGKREIVCVRERDLICDYSVTRKKGKSKVGLRRSVKRDLLF